MDEEIYAFVDDQDVKEIIAPFFKDGEVVTIKKFSYADRQALTGEYMRLSADWGGRKGKEDKEGRRKATVTSEIVLGKMNLSILDKGIESWTLFNRKGKEVPLSRTNIRKLSDEYAEFILGEINDFNPTRSSDEEDEAATADADALF